MVAAVLDVDICNVFGALKNLERYKQAFILIRVGEQPVGQVWLPVENGQISEKSIVDVASQSLGKRIWQQVLLHSYREPEPSGLAGDQPSATVAVVTHDRPKDLRRCLDAVLSLPDDGQEYIVVDSCPSTDLTQRILSAYPDRVRYVRENKRGASAARNRALRVAANDIVVFTDDDAFPDPGWLRALLRNFADPLVLCATGLVLPFELETEAQYWFERYSPHGRGFSRVVFDCINHDPYSVSPIGVSASVALRKSVLESVGGFEEALSPGTPAYAGEDAELFSRILTAGYRIAYDPAAVSWHRHRRTWQELRRTIYGYGVAVYAQWLHTLLVEHEYSVIRLPAGWLFGKQLPNLIRSLLHRPESYPVDLLLLELLGCAVGPFAYLRSRRIMKQDRLTNE